MTASAIGTIPQPFDGPVPFAAGTRLMAWVNTPRGGLILLVGTTLVARLLFAAALGLGVDESYMVAAGRTIRFGYFDHPPIAW